jgi:hypothetical protein
MRQVQKVPYPQKFNPFLKRLPGPKELVIYSQKKFSRKFRNLFLFKKKSYEKVKKTVLKKIVFQENCKKRFKKILNKN